MRDIEIYTDGELTLNRLANELNLPSRTLSAIIRDNYGMNFYEFVNTFRIEKAKELLSDSEHLNKSITTIYLDVGFNSKSVFNTFFKKSVGMTPSQFRTTHCKKT